MPVTAAAKASNYDATSVLSASHANSGADGSAAPGIRLRLLDDTDRDLYHALHASPEVMRAIGPPLAPNAIEARFGRVLRHNRVANPGHRTWAIECVIDARSVGITALLRNAERAEFGVMLLAAAQRRGIATAAIAVLLPHAFESMALEHVDASRPDDAFVSAIDGMFAPFGFRRAPGLRTGEAGWTLSRERWLAMPRAPDPG